MRAIDKETMFDLIIKAKRTDPETGSFAEWLAAYLVERLPTLTPPNEPEYREYTCPYCYHTWLEDRDASDYPNYCPVCRATLRDGSTPPNEPLTSKGDENSER